MIEYNSQARFVHRQKVGSCKNKLAISPHEYVYGVLSLTSVVPPGDAEVSALERHGQERFASAQTSVQAWKELLEQEHPLALEWDRACREAMQRFQKVEEIRSWMHQDLTAERREQILKMPEFRVQPEIQQFMKGELESVMVWHAAEIPGVGWKTRPRMLGPVKVVGARVASRRKQLGQIPVAPDDSRSAVILELESENGVRKWEVRADRCIVQKRIPDQLKVTEPGHRAEDLKRPVPEVVTGVQRARVVEKGVPGVEEYSPKRLA